MATTSTTIKVSLTVLVVKQAATGELDAALPVVSPWLECDSPTRHSYCSVVSTLRTCIAVAHRCHWICSSIHHPPRATLQFFNLRKNSNKLLHLYTSALPTSLDAPFTRLDRNRCRGGDIHAREVVRRLWPRPVVYGRKAPPSIAGHDVFHELLRQVQDAREVCEAFGRVATGAAGKPVGRSDGRGASVNPGAAGGFLLRGWHFPFFRSLL